MDLSKEETFALIEGYRKRDILWDPRHPDRYDKGMKDVAWKDISQEMNKSVDRCKRKMEYLLSALRREKMKMRKRINLGKEEYKCSWFAFEALKFIWNRGRPRGTTTAIRPLTSEQLTSHRTKPERSICVERTSRRREANTSDDQRLDNAFEALTASNKYSNDESYHFGNLVASKLRTYDTHVRCVIQNDILSLFVKANSGYYNSMYPSSNRVYQVPRTSPVQASYPRNSSHSPNHLSPTSQPQAEPDTSPNNTFLEDFKM